MEELQLVRVDVLRLQPYNGVFLHLLDLVVR